MLATKEYLPEVLDLKKSAFGCLNEYANASKISLEKGAWGKEVIMKQKIEKLQHWTRACKS